MVMDLEAAGDGSMPAVEWEEGVMKWNGRNG
jgi:hypothetical protein